MNLLESVMSLLGSGDIVSKISGLIGTNKEGAEGAIKSAVPTVIGGLMSKATTSEGASGIFDLIKSGGYDGGNLMDLAGAFGGGASTDSWLSKGASLLSGIFGDKSTEVTNQLASSAGISSGASSKLLGMITPVIMGVLGKEVASKGLNAGSLASLLGDQGGFLQGLLPSWLTNMFSLGSLTGGIKGALGDTADAAKSVVSGTTNIAKDVAGDTFDMGKKVVTGAADMTKGVATGAIDMGRKVASEATDMTREVAESGGSAMKKLLPLLLLLLGAFLVWWLWKGCNKSNDASAVAGDSAAVSTNMDSAINATNNAAAVADSANTATQVTDSAATNGTTAQVTDSAANSTNATAAATTVAGQIDSASGNYIADVGAMTTITLPNGTAMQVGERSIESKLYKFLSDPSMTVDTADKTKGWMSLDRVYFETGKSVLTKESQKQVENLATILKAFPTAQIKIGGYTDNTGSEATNMKVSGQRAGVVLSNLAKLGATKENMKSEGYGPQHPVASNETAEGRAQNRRVDIRVTQK